MIKSCTTTPENSHYKDGIEAENMVKNDLETSGWKCCLSSGSKGPVDIYAFDQDHTKHGIQVRLRHGGKCSMTHKEQNKLISFSKKIGAIPVLAAVCKECSSFALQNLITEERIRYD